jgi:hypothetical protein
MIDEYKNLISSAIINERSDLDVVYNTPYGEGLRDILGESVVPYRNSIFSLAESLGLGTNLPTHAFIPYWNWFFSQARVTENNLMEVKYNVPYGTDENIIYNQVIIPYRKDFFNQAFVEPIHRDYVGRAYNPHLNLEHKGIARINENLELDVGLRMIAPPINELTVSVLKDTYTRQAKPTINYGTSQTLIAGMAADGEYKTYIEFDLKQIIDLQDMNFTSLKLVIDKLDSTDGRVDIYECYTKWHENYLIWLSTIEHSPEPILSSTFYGTSVEFEILPLIKQMIEQGKTTLNLVIKSPHTIILKAKESGVPPKLVLQYTDPNWNGFIDAVEMTNQAIIRALAKKDIYSSYKLVEHLFLNASATLRNGRDNFGRAEINRGLITGYAEPAVSKYVNAQAVFRVTKGADLPSFYNHNALNGDSNAYVPYRADVFGRAVIPPEASVDDFNGKLDIIRTYVFSLAELIRSAAVGSSAVIRITNEKDLLASADILNEFITNKATLNLRSISYGSVIVRKRELEHLISKMQIDTPYLYSDYELRKHSISYGSARLNGLVSKDITAYANVNTPNMRSWYQLRKNHNFASLAIIKVQGFNDLINSAFVAEKSELNAQARLRAVGCDEKTGEIIVRRSDIDDKTGYGNLLIGKDLVSEATLRRSDIKEVMSESIVRRSDVDDIHGYFNIPYRRDLLAQAIVRRSDYRDIDAEGIVRRSDYRDLYGISKLSIGNDVLSESTIRQSAWKDLNSEGIVRRSDSYDAVASADLFRVSQINSQAQLYRVVQLNGTAIIRQLDVSHSYWEAFVAGGFHRSHKVSSAEFAVKASYLTGYATIRSGARIWRPNEEGELVYEDRKLPRIWRRELFIP